MFDWLLQPFLDFAFMRRALVGCLALSLGATPIGVFMLLRRMSLTGDAMAHGILPGAAVGYLWSGLSLTAMTLGGLLAGMAVAFIAAFIARHTQLKEDASLAAIYLISLALGVLIISSRGGHIDLLHILFGTVLALNQAALWLMVSIASISLVGMAIIFRPLAVECLDPGFLRSVSRSGSWVHFIFMGLMVLNLVGGFHALGTLMAVGLMILPASAAQFWGAHITRIILTAVFLAVVSSFLGLLWSFYYDLPAGPAIILVVGGFYLISLVFGSHGSLRVRGRHVLFR